MNIIPGFERIKKREILDCRIKALQEIIQFTGCNMNSFELLIICEAITFRYGYINYKEHNLYDVPYVTSTNMDIHEYLFKRLGISYVCEKISSDDVGWEKLKVLLDAQIPVLVEIDGSIFIKERKVHFTDLHYISYILLIGYNEETREVAFVLHQSSKSDTYITLKYEDFQAARIKKSFPYEVTGKCYYLSESINIENIDIQNILKSSIKNIASKMLEGGVESDICSETTDITDVYIGLPGIKKIISDYRLKSLRLLINKKIISRYQLEFLILRNNIQYGTITCYREEFSKALYLIADKYNMPEYKKVAALYEKSIIYWKRLIWQIGILAKNRKKISFKGMWKISRIFQKIYKQEKKAVRLIIGIE